MKIAIITRNANPWVYFVISQLTLHGIEVVVVNEQRRSSQNWASMRFIRRRGWVSFLDLLLQHSLALLARLRPKVGDSDTRDANRVRLQPFDPNAPFEFRKTLAELVQQGTAENRLVTWRNVELANSQTTSEFIRAAGTDFVILCGAPLIKISQFASAGVLINAHCGICPQYRGSSPIHWAAYRRDWGNLGFTLHIASSRVDGGPILHQECHQPRSGWNLTYLDWFLVYTMYERLCQLIVERRLDDLLKHAVKQPRGFASHPPMGLIRSAIALRRLHRYLAKTQGS